MRNYGLRLFIDADTTYTTLKECTESEFYVEKNGEMKKRIRGLSGGLVEVKGHESHEEKNKRSFGRFGRG